MAESVCKTAMPATAYQYHAEEIVAWKNEEKRVVEGNAVEILGLNAEAMPKHVAFVMDGNSRWAKSRGLPTSEGHSAGAEALVRTVKLSCKYGIPVVTFFAFSVENWSRPKGEVDCIMWLIESVLTDLIELFFKDNVRFYVIGDVSKVPESLQKVFEEVEECTKSNTGTKLVLAVSYSGRTDVLHACKNLADMVEKGMLKSSEITEKMLSECLQTNVEDIGGLGDPDLVIRTSGEKRLSNFLLWQSAYSELYFEDCLWPDFGEAQYIEALKAFQSRKRRFGKRDPNDGN